MKRRSRKRRREGKKSIEEGSPEGEEREVGRGEENREIRRKKRKRRKEL